MQTIPIIIFEKVLKNIFLESIDQINKIFKNNYEVFDEYSTDLQDSISIILDIRSLENISELEIKNRKIFIINDLKPASFEKNSNYIFIERPFKVSELFTEHFQRSLKFLLYL